MLYNHWGTYVGPAGAAQEPNNPAAQCAVANYTQEFDNAWGWDDTSCLDRFPIMCRWGKLTDALLYSLFLLAYEVDRLTTNTIVCSWGARPGQAVKHMLPALSTG